MSSLPSSRLAVQSVSADAEPIAVSVVEGTVSAQPDESQPMQIATTEAADTLLAESMSSAPVISRSVDNGDDRDVSVAESFSVFTAASPRRTSSLPKTSAAADQTDATAEKSWPLPLTQLVEAQHSAVHTLRGHIFPKEPGGVFFLAVFAVVVAFVLATIALMDNSGSFQAVTDKVEATARAQVAAQVNPMLAVRGGELGLAGASKARGTSNGASALDPKIIKLSDCGS
jgi:hypothetical protein